jgi:uncharacterized membrane protein
MFPPLPTWDAFHVLIIHFPVACFVLTPLVLAWGLLCKPNRTPLLIAAFLLMTVGTIATYIATATGESAEEFIQTTPQIKAIMEEHQELGENLRNLFTGLTILYAAVLIGPHFLKKPVAPKIITGVYAVLLLGSLGGLLLTATTAHEGGRLVHVYGIHARLEPGSAPAQPAHATN